MARPCSNVDPANLNVDPKAKRKRPDRKRPDPLPSAKADEARARARAEKRPASPGVMLEPAGDHSWRTVSPHNDPGLWELQIADAFGTRSQSVSRTFLRDLKHLCRQQWDEDLQRWKTDETEMNAALAMVADIRPRNTMEAALAAQMVAVHWMQLRLSQQALRNNHVYEADAATAGKLARTFTMQMDSLRALRGRKKTSKQSITVRKELHQHVHYHHHRGDEEDDRQCHGRDAAFADQRGSVSGQEPGGKVVSLPSRSRQG